MMPFILFYSSLLFNIFSENHHQKIKVEEKRKSELLRASLSKPSKLAPSPIIAAPVKPLDANTNTSINNSTRPPQNTITETMSPLSPTSSYTKLEDEDGPAAAVKLKKKTLNLHDLVRQNREQQSAASTVSSTSSKSSSKTTSPDITTDEGETQSAVCCTVS